MFLIRPIDSVQEVEVLMILHLTFILRFRTIIPEFYKVVSLKTLLHRVVMRFLRPFLREEFQEFTESVTSEVSTVTPIPMFLPTQV